MARRLLSLLRPVVDRFPRIASLYRTFRDQSCSIENPELTPWGFKLAGNPSMVQGVFEPDETQLVRSILEEVDILVNVGANIGYYCCHALSMGKQVIAFEPIQRNVRYLCSNIKANNWPRIEIYPVALSNSAGVLEMYGGNTGASILKGWAGTPESYVTLVPTSTLDIILGNRLQGKKALILVDIEGAEKWMLEGALNILATEPKPIWIVEILSKEFQPSGVEINPNFKDTFQLFFQNGYQAYTADHNLNRITTDDLDHVLDGSSKYSTHNFMFCTSKPL